MKGVSGRLKISVSILGSTALAHAVYLVPCWDSAVPMARAPPLTRTLGARVSPVAMSSLVTSRLANCEPSCSAHPGVLKGGKRPVSVGLVNLWRQPRGTFQRHMDGCSLSCRHAVVTHDSCRDRLIEQEPGCVSLALPASRKPEP